MTADEEHAQINHFLTNTGWTGVIKPQITRTVKGLYEKLLDPSQKRKEESPDDYLRGQIKAYREIIEWPIKRAAFLNNALEDRRREEEAKNNDEA